MLIGVSCNVRNKLLCSKGQEALSVENSKGEQHLQGDAMPLQSNVLALKAYFLEVVVCDFVRDLG